VVDRFPDTEVQMAIEVKQLVDGRRPVEEDGVVVGYLVEETQTAGRSRPTPVLTGITLAGTRTTPSPIWRGATPPEIKRVAKQVAHIARRDARTPEEVAADERAMNSALAAAFADGFND
jgi:hypothetical protein